MRYFKLTIAYEGTNYVGWQVQPNGPSIQACLEKAWAAVCQEDLRITASGRTDAGVHARGQVASLGSNTELDRETLCRAINANLPHDIRLLEVEVAGEGFHAIRDSVSKTYRYQLQFGPQVDLFQRLFRWYVRGQLDVEAMQEAAELLTGKHDFASFQASGAETLTTVRTVSDLRITGQSTGNIECLDLDISADGFLYNMVRNIVGTLVEVGLGKQSPDWVREVLEANDRRVAGPTAPPHGLFLQCVRYPSDVSPQS